jgi:hypothetical protein
MALELQVDSLESVPEAVRTLYVEQDGKFKLDVAGVPDTTGLKSALDAERKAAKEAAKQLNEFKTKYDGIDPEEFLRLRQEREAAEEAKLKAEGKAEEIAERRMEKAKAEYQSQVDAVKAENEALNKKLQVQARNALRGKAQAAASGKVHADESALGIVADMAEKLWHFDENETPVMYDSEGQVVLGKDGRTPFTLSEWVDSLKETHKFLFPSLNTGGGASGGKQAVNGKSMTREEHDRRAAKGEPMGAFFASGGRIID